MKPQFVTAIYTGLEGTRFNGNAAAIYDRYKNSLKSLADGGYSIVCFTSKDSIDDLREHFKDNPNVDLRVEELDEYVMHRRIEQIKDARPEYTTIDSWRSRCVEIMWGKFSWLARFLNEMEDDESIYWIDAGLFHGGLISNTMRSETSKGYFDFDTITQQRNLFDDLVKFSEGKILNIRSSIVNHGSDDYQTVFETRPEYGIVGGVFGGNKQAMIKYYESWCYSVVHTLSRDCLLKEEEIMYFIHHDEPSNFKTFEFNNWYHQDWPIELYDPAVHTSFSDFFKVIRE